MTLYLLTDSAELAKYEGQIEKAIAGGTGTLSVKPGALAASGEKLPGAISRQTYENLWNARRNVSGASSAWLGTLDGRLALGGLLVNLFAVKKSLSELGEAAKGAGEREGRERTNKQIGVIDAFAGTLGAGIEVYQVLIKENVVKAAQRAAVARGAAGEAVAEAGEIAVKASAKLSWLRALGGLFGFVGGTLAAVTDYRKAQDAAAAGQNDLRIAYVGAVIAFAGVTTTSTATMAGAIAEAILKSRAKSAAARAAIEVIGEAALERTAARLGAEATLGIIELSIPGIGWICLAVGLGAEFWIAWRTPTALQTWVSRSYFGVRTGKDPEHAPFPRGQWQVEYDALLKMFAPTPAPSEGADRSDSTKTKPNLAGAHG